MITIKHITEVNFNGFIFREGDNVILDYIYEDNSLLKHIVSEAVFCGIEADFLCFRDIKKDFGFKLREKEISDIREC